MSTWEEYLQNQLNCDGIQMTWNVLPHSRLDAQKLVIPVSSFFTPLKEKPADQPKQPVLEYDPILCQKQSCKAILNALCMVDYRTKVWACPFCNQRNPFPPHYAAISEDNRPPELHPLFTTIEYTLKKATVLPPIFLFVVDTCIAPEELKALKESLQKAISYLPADALIGLITFGRMVEIHELNVKSMARSYVFKGTKEANPKQLRDIIALQIGLPNGTVRRQSAASTPIPHQPGQQSLINGINPGVIPTHPARTEGAAQFPGSGHLPPAGPHAQAGVSNLPLVGGASAVQSVSNKFLQPISDCEVSIGELIEKIQTDRWPVPQGQRSLRAIGAAFSVAVTLLEVSFPNTGARIMSFIGGPCTHGPGMVVNEELRDPIRSWHDIKEDNVPFMRKAFKFYDSLAERAVKNGHAIDIFSCALDQTGLYEMKSLYNSTNGLVVMADSFDSTLFKQTFQKVFEKDADGSLKMTFNASLEVKVSNGLKVEGVLGCCSSANVKNSMVSDTEVGVGGTTQWKFCTLTPRNTIAVAFEISGQHGVGIPQGARAMMQFITQYQHSDGHRRVRVTTTCRSWADMEANKQSVGYSFDQDAGTVYMARLASWRASSENDSPDTLRWLDRSLIRLVQRFGDYHKEDPASLKLSDKFSLFPQFMFHLRRSQFLQVFNNSPDETVYYRHIMMSENVFESTTMIQPQLFSYSFNGPPEPVLLDTSSILPDRILLMDDYFHVLIYHGQTIASWRKANYHTDPQYASFKQLLEAPVQDATSIIQDRFPVPRYIVTEYEGSQARFLLSKVNPSLTHNNPYSQEGGAPVFTDDVSMQVFMEHLRKLAVSAST
uniref:Protein transport protein SEC23 n=1 Tax=Globodera rostochiensis TaxID=31243 RepID=A0A914HCX9_GLORO